MAVRERLVHDHELRVATVVPQSRPDCALNKGSRCRQSGVAVARQPRHACQPDLFGEQNQVIGGMHASKPQL